MSVQNLRIGWVGFHQEGIRALRGLLESGIRLEGVVTLDETALAKRSAGAGQRGHSTLLTGALGFHTFGACDEPHGAAVFSAGG